MLTFYCSPADADTLAVTVKAQSGQPVHLRRETVYGRDFGDARVAEQVAGALDRAALEVVTPHAQADALVTAVSQARRAQPVRWMMTPVLARGRLP